MAEMLTQEKTAAEYWQSANPANAWFTIRHRVGQTLLRALPGFLLPFAEVGGAQTGVWAAYGMALACMGETAYPAALGVAMAFLMRLVWGLSVRWELLLGAAMMLLAPHAFRWRPEKQHAGVRLLVATGLALLPGAVMAVVASSAERLLQGLAALMIGTLSAPVMLRALRAVAGGRAFETMESRLSVGYLLLMMLCGASRMMLPWVNLGVLGASGASLCAALFLGVSPACVMGMMSGVVLVLQGLPLGVAVALSLGGFLGGMGQALGRRGVSCALFSLGAGSLLLLCHAQGLGALGAVVASGAAMALLPRKTLEVVKQQTRRFSPQQTASGDAYAAYALRQWEKTVEDMAQAVPSPNGLGENRDGAWWQEHLCASCPELAACGCMNTELGVKKAEGVWRWRDASDGVWEQRKEELRGLGCARLYLLMESMDLLRAEAAEKQRQLRRACQQRDMLVTHLTALSGSARRYAALSMGESWWDAQYANRLRRAVAEEELPARLSFVRQSDGHVQVAYELHGAESAAEQASTLCALTSRCLERPMTIAEVEKGAVRLWEMPLLMVEIGTADACMPGGTVSGDTCYLGQLQDGRFLAALSDGMGHGDAAAVESRQTVELLHLCLNAGYDRTQALTAVNGMMLLAGRGERFSTVDMLLLDLWTGQATLNKLGAAGSYRVHEGTMTRLSGDALPLGILEDVESGENRMRLQEGDTLVMMSDGIEDAFGSRVQLEEAVEMALTGESAQAAAEALRLFAMQAQSDVQHDDQTVIILRIIRATPEKGIKPVYS